MLLIFWAGHMVGSYGRIRVEKGGAFESDWSAKLRCSWLFQWTSVRATAFYLTLPNIAPGIRDVRRELTCCMVSVVDSFRDWLDNGCCYCNCGHHLLLLPLSYFLPVLLFLLFLLLLFLVFSIFISSSSREGCVTLQVSVIWCCHDHICAFFLTSAATCSSK